jgi:hypothetical protein
MGKDNKDEDGEITEDNGKNEEINSIIKIENYNHYTAAEGDGFAFEMNGRPHDNQKSHGNNTHIVFPYHGGFKEIFQKEDDKKGFIKLDWGDDGVPKPKLNLGELKEKGYVGYRVQSIKGKNDKRST